MDKIAVVLDRLPEVRATLGDLVATGADVSGLLLAVHMDFWIGAGLGIMVGSHLAVLVLTVVRRHRHPRPRPTPTGRIWQADDFGRATLCADD